MILLKKKERARFLRFTVVGAFGAVVDFGTFNLLTLVFSIPGVIAQVFSFTAAVSSNFTWNRFWTYPDSRSKDIRRQVVEFSVVSIIGIGIRTPIFAWLQGAYPGVVVRLPWQLPFSPEFVSRNLALATAVIIVMFWNFFVNRFWTYSDVD